MSLLASTKKPRASKSRDEVEECVFGLGGVAAAGLFTLQYGLFAGNPITAGGSSIADRDGNGILSQTEQEAIPSIEGLQLKFDPELGRVVVAPIPSVNEPDWIKEGAGNPGNVKEEDPSWTPIAAIGALIAAQTATLMLIAKKNKEIKRLKAEKTQLKNQLGKRPGMYFLSQQQKTIFNLQEEVETLKDKLSDLEQQEKDLEDLDARMFVSGGFTTDTSEDSEGGASSDLLDLRPSEDSEGGASSDLLDLRPSEDSEGGASSDLLDLLPPPPSGFGEEGGAERW